MTTCSPNLNPLYNSYFRLIFGRGLKQMELLCQKVNVPGISIGEQPQPTTLGTTIPIPTHAIQFAPLTVEFIVDSNLQNWKNLYSWIRNLTNIDTDTDHNLEYQDWHHQANLLIYDGFNETTPTTFKFYHIIPVELGGFSFQSDSSDVIIQKAVCRFKYSHYIITPDAPSNLKNTA
jgi:hypothetical protein